MATIKACDFCDKRPDNLTAQSGGDVRHVRVGIDARTSDWDAASDDAPVKYEFDACHACRLRLLGSVMENIGLVVGSSV